MTGSQRLTRPTGDLAGRLVRRRRCAGRRARAHLGRARHHPRPRRPGALLRRRSTTSSGRPSTADALRDAWPGPAAAKLSVMAIALAIGTGRVWLLFVGLNGAVDLLGGRGASASGRTCSSGRRSRCSRSSSIVPAVLTILASAHGGRRSPSQNWAFVLTSPEMWLAFRNNIAVAGARAPGAAWSSACWSRPSSTGSSARPWPRRSSSCRWRSDGRRGRDLAVRLRLAARRASRRSGSVNAAWTALGNDAGALAAGPRPLNTLALIVIMIWLQTGFAMVVLSAALKGVPSEVIEAARMDGAGEARSSSGSSCR